MGYLRAGELSSESGTVAAFPSFPSTSTFGDATMTTPANRNDKDIPTPEEIPADLNELSTLVAGLSPEHRHNIEPVLARVIESTKRRRRILGLVQDALSQLRLDMKYLVFDLEATRRERDNFRQELEERTNLGDGQ